MKDKQTKYPQLRFKGFTDPWEQRKLGDYYEFKNGLNKGKEAFGSGSPIVNFVDVFHNRRLTPNMLSGRVNLTDKEILNFEVQDGDLFFTRTSETIDEIGFPSVMDGSPKATTFSGFVLRGRAVSMDPLITSFKAYVFFTDAFRVEMKKKSSMTTRALTSGSALKKMFFNFPAQQDEQQKIGTFFQQLDGLITLHQRKLAKLKKLKQGYLQKLFPKNGSKFPQLRFAGFADAWEQRKLGDLLKEFSIKSKIEDEHKVLSSTNSGMEFREGRVSGTSNLGYKIIKNGDLVLSPQNLWLGNININNIGKGLVSPSYKTFELINIDSSFINPQLRTQKMLEEYKNSSTQGASVVRRNLEIDSFYQIKIFVPTISEQEKIGSFFQQLDNTIVLHQRKLEKLQELKKGYLQKMFC
ncbi:restriction endonuclease subunit S [Levilactobacillus brevis]|uniref:restriction endonuclease subunit S n=1 Tax=Levilactobacillus brevis TaxID=1580 RepID=UPI003F4B7CB6